MASTPPQDPSDHQSSNPYPPVPPPPRHPGYPEAPAPPVTGEIPGRTLGIIGLILSFFTALIGLIVSIIAFRQSKKAGHKNIPALAGIIIGGVATLIGVIVAIGLIAFLATLPATCAKLGPGIHHYHGVTYTCS